MKLGRTHLASAAGTAALTAVLLAAAFPAGAQPAFDIALDPTLATLSGRVPRADDRTFAGQLDAEYQAGGLRLWYALDAASYLDEGDWATWLHGVGATARLLPKHSKARLYLGATGALRRNGSSWSEADYESLGAFANVELKPTTGLTLRGGYRFDTRRFARLTAGLDQREHDGFLSLHANLPSRTTLIGELHLGTKSYQGETVAPAADTPGQPMPAAGSGGRGAGGTQGQRPTVVLPAHLSAGSARAGRANWMLRVAQSLFDRTGLSLQYSQRLTSGDVPPALISTPALFFDDGVYDDPFASDALRLRANLKQAFASGAWVEASGAWTRKDYRAAPALDAEGTALPDGALRADRVWQASLAAVLPIFAGRTGAWSLELQPAWRWTRSRSNDAYYDYSSHAVTLGMSFSY